MKQQSTHTHTDNNMAAAAEVLLLVTLMSNNIHAQVLQRPGESHHFLLNKTADFCLLSRWTGEEKKLLWNSSEPSEEGKAYYRIYELKVSDSGQYQEQCWTQGQVTHERNSTLLACDDRKMTDQRLFLHVGQTLELTCDGAGPNQSVQWAFEKMNDKTKSWEIDLIDDETSSLYKLQLVNNKSSLLVTSRHYASILLYCLEKNHERCDLLSQFYVHVQPELLLRSVGESLEMNCSDIRGNQSHVWMMYNSVMIGEAQTHNYTLMFPSLTLNHTGDYLCHHSVYFEYYHLFVCPESDPPAVVFFTGGENVTLQCGDGKQTQDIVWSMRSNRTEGRVLVVNYHQTDRVYLSNTSLVIANVALEDSGEFWCVVMKDDHCVFTSKTLVMFGEPEVDHHLVRSVLLIVVVMMMCVVVVVVVWRARSREQLPGPVEELEMSELSPDLQLETGEHDPCE